jgi:hypothetical protein
VIRSTTTVFQSPRPNRHPDSYRRLGALQRVTRRRRCLRSCTRSFLPIWSAGISCRPFDAQKKDLWVRRALTIRWWRGRSACSRTSMLTIAQVIDQLGPIATRKALHEQAIRMAMANWRLVHTCDLSYGKECCPSFPYRAAPLLLWTRASNHCSW